MTSQTLEPKYTLSVAARLSETAVHSIRQYIDKGLILPFKTETKRHLFSDVDILRLKCIRGMLDNQGLNIAGVKAMYSLVPCWVIRPCSVDDRKDCDAFHSSEAPCWEASEKGPACKNTDCRVCDVYRLPEKCSDMKTLLKKMIQ